MLAGLCNTLENFLTIVAYILPIVLNLSIACINSSRNIFFADPLHFPELLNEALDHAFSVVDGQEWLQKTNVLFAQDVHIDPNILSIRGNNRTVEIIC